MTRLARVLRFALGFDTGGPVAVLAEVVCAGLLALLLLAGLADGPVALCRPESVSCAGAEMRELTP